MRHISAGQGGWTAGTAGDDTGRPGTVGDGRALVRTAGDCGGRPGTTRVMSRDFSLAGTEGPSAKTIVPYSPSGPYPPGRSPS